MPPPLVSPDPNSPEFDSLDGAADAVSKGFGKASNSELAAVVFQRADGKYVHSNVIQSDHNNFALRAQIPPGGKLAAIAHSHPGSDDNGQLFSPQDIDVATRLNVPSYVRFLRDDSIRRFTPGKTATQRIQDGHFKLTVARGDPVLAPDQKAALASSVVSQVLQSPPSETAGGAR